MDELKSANKPIPAITENGEFVEATLEGIAGERIRIVWICGAEVAAYKVVPIREDDFAVFYLDPDDIKDWPAVRERVERARTRRTKPYGGTQESN